MMRKELRFLLIYLFCNVSLAFGAEEKDFVGYHENRIEAVLSKEKEAYEFAVLNHATISPPMGKWALLRNDEGLCAIRFNKFWRSHVDDKDFRYSHEEFFANYEWYFRSDRVGKFVDGDFQSGKGLASIKPQIWRFERKMGIKCGSMKFDWAYPNRIFPPKKAHEMAFTGWADISDINANEKSLIWIDHLPEFREPSPSPYGKYKVPVNELLGAGGNQSLPSKP